MIHKGFGNLSGLPAVAQIISKLWFDLPLIFLIFCQNLWDFHLSNIHLSNILSTYIKINYQKILIKIYNLKKKQLYNMMGHKWVLNSCFRKKPKRLTLANCCVFVKFTFILISYCLCVFFIFESNYFRKHFNLNNVNIKKVVTFTLKLC